MTGKAANEPDARRLPPLLAVRPLARSPRSLLVRRDLPARLAASCIVATRAAGTAAGSRAFLGGLATLFLALASPIEPFAALLLQVHMIQHLLLMMVAPPLLWLGAPLFPMLRGLPRPIRTYWVVPAACARDRCAGSSRG